MKSCGELTIMSQHLHVINVFERTLQAKSGEFLKHKFLKFDLLNSKIE